ncbi:DUF4012 domain-containing protein [Ktedonospora formicarum]|nr:DUF4012 domain-containing protein [Ktedonospora formicarum]
MEYPVTPKPEAVEDLPTVELGVVPASKAVEDLPTIKTEIPSTSPQVENLPAVRFGVVPAPKAVEDLPTVKMGASPSLHFAETKERNQKSTGKGGKGLLIRVAQLKKTFSPSSLKQMTKRQRLSLAVRLLLVFCILAPLAGGIVYAMQGLTTYNSLREHANQGVQHFQNIKTLLSGSTALNPAQKQPNILNEQKLKLSLKELQDARTEFTIAQQTLNTSSFVHLVEQNSSSYQQQIVAARQALGIGIEATYMGEDALHLVMKLAPKLSKPLLASSKDPLVTSSDLALIQQTLKIMQPRFERITTSLHQLSLDALPLSDQQRAQAKQYLQLLPQVEQGFSLANNLTSVAGWLLGVDKQRTFLVQTMDRGELRATGGFNGQYGELTVSGGRFSPLTLKDISLIEYVAGNPTNGQLAPSAYRSWWPFANWGVRDANLSADFPTSAKIITDLYHSEVNRDVDGVIMFSPFLIERVLEVTGPITINEYHETITSQNLEERLHYYQLDNAGIRKAELVEHVEDPAQARKLFTSRLAKVLMERIQSAPLNDLLLLGTMFMQNLKTKDLEVYLNNEQAQSLLSRYGYAAEIDRSTTHDGLYIVQANVSASKASQFTRSIFKDNVTLDAQGGATHVLQIRLAYNQIGSVYGLDTLRDYVRIYVPSSAKFLGGDGFYTNDPLCGGGFGTCSRDGIYSHQQLICPPGQYEAGASAPMLDDPYYQQWHPLNQIGEPTNFQSDEPGRAMFAGYLVVPKNCTLSASVSWYVPPMGKDPYQLLVQRQSGTFPELDLSLLPPSGNCASLSSQGVYYNGPLTQDRLFQSKSPTNAVANNNNCYPGPGV